MAFFEANVILQAFGVQDPVKKMKSSDKRIQTKAQKKNGSYDDLIPTYSRRPIIRTSWRR